MKNQFEAKFTKMNNDLFWDVVIEGVKLDWFGYNDSFWWKNIANDENYATRTVGENKYKIDFRTNIVEKIL